MNLFFLLLLQIFLRASSYSCLDENGNPVDWWVAIVATGSPAYYYYNISEPNNKFSLSPYDVFQTKNGAIMQTTNQIYSFQDGVNINSFYVQTYRFLNLLPMYICRLK